MHGPQPREGIRSSALHLHGHGAHLVGLGNGDGEQPIAVHGLQLLALDRDREAEATAPGAVAVLAQQWRGNWPTALFGLDSGAVTTKDVAEVVGSGLEVLARQRSFSVAAICPWWHPNLLEKRCGTPTTGWRCCWDAAGSGKQLDGTWYRGLLSTRRVHRSLLPLRIGGADRPAHRPAWVGPADSPGSCHNPSPSAPGAGPASQRLPPWSAGPACGRSTGWNR